LHTERNEFESIVAIVLKQRRFAAAVGSSADDCWSIPIVFARGDGYVGMLQQQSTAVSIRGADSGDDGDDVGVGVPITVQRIMMPAQKTFRFELPSALTAKKRDDDDWLLVNLGRVGFYHVLYDDTLMSSVGSAMLNGR
jgi:hypothetical protein